MNSTSKKHIEFHFDVPNKMISARTLACIAEGLEDVTNSLFEGNLAKGEQAEVYLCVPKDGCFEAIFKIVAPFVAGAFVSVAGPSLINSFFKGTIGMDLDEIISSTTEKLTDSLRQNLIIDSTCVAIGAFLSKKNKEDLETLHSDFPKELSRLQRGKNKIYNAMATDERVLAVSYTGDNYIKRSEFSAFIDENLEDDELCEQAFYHGRIKIISPVSLKEKSRRGWTCHFLAQKNDRIERTFEIDDDNFRSKAIQRDIKLAADDIAEVQMVKDGTQKPNWRVLRVLKFDGVTISEPLTKEELEQLSIKPNQVIQDQLSFLDQL